MSHVPVEVAVPGQDAGRHRERRHQRIHLLATRDHLSAAADLASMAPWLAGRVRAIAYGTLLRAMTPAYWRDEARRAYWELAGCGWKPSREALHAAATSAAFLLRYLGARRRPRSGVYIFADLELLSGRELQKAAVVWEALAAAGPDIRLLNHPARSMRRYELLRTLHERGINRFDAYRLTEARRPARYPVFLRREDDHAGPLSPLLRTPRELEAALSALDRRNQVRDGLMIVEFCDTADVHGIYRKYGAFVVGERVFIKSVQFSRHWVQKNTDLKATELLREERDYVERNPHEEALREIFKLARIDYGRMDYSLLDGRIQVWEINTNPAIASPAATRVPARAPVYEHAARTMVEALEELCGHGPAA